MTERLQDWPCDRAEIEAAIDRETAACIAAVARVASDLNIDAFLVGGLLREIVAGRPLINTSPDVAVMGDAADLAKALASELDDCSSVATSRHHTAKVKIGSIVVDIASARIDVYDPPGSLPQITLVDDIELDLSRRDFSANAIAVPIYPTGFGQLIDPFGGRNDTLNRKLRVLHEGSFADDPLRMLRGARFAARYDFEFESETAKLLSKSLNHLQNMCRKSPQRVFNEFRLWFETREILSEEVRIAAETGLITALGITDDLQSDALRDVRPNSSELERFAAFAYTVPPDALDSFVDQLKMPTVWRSVAGEVNKARRVALRCSVETPNDLELRRSLINVRDEVIRAIASVHTDPAVKHRFDDFRTRLRRIRPSLNGDDLVALGVERGPMVGELLNELLEQRIQGLISTKAEERDFIVRRLSVG